MKLPEIDRIQNAIRHIQTSADVDQWAVEIAVEAMEKQIPKKSCSTSSFFRYNCPSCGNHFPLNGKYCDKCGQAIDWSE